MIGLALLDGAGPAGRPRAALERRRRRARGTLFHGGRVLMARRPAAARACRGRRTRLRHRGRRALPARPRKFPLEGARNAPDALDLLFGGPAPPGDPRRLRPEQVDSAARCSRMALRRGALRIGKTSSATPSPLPCRPRRGRACRGDEHDHAQRPRGARSVARPAARAVKLLGRSNYLCLRRAQAPGQGTRRAARSSSSRCPGASSSSPGERPPGDRTSRDYDLGEGPAAPFLRLHFRRREAGRIGSS
jgi:hypothetical protein